MLKHTHSRNILRTAIVAAAGLGTLSQIPAASAQLVLEEVIVTA